MRIACPACAAAYEVPDRLLAGAPRMLRCSRCGAEFAPPRPAPPEPDPPPPRAPEPPPDPPPAPPEPPDPAFAPVAAPAPATVAEPATAAEPQPALGPAPPAAAPAAPPELRPGPRPATRQAPHGEAALTRAWLASIAAVLIGLAALIVFRARVMEAWPPSMRLFAALGLA
jgi:predicted Zn finger-like uncharacterized protein